MLIKKLLQLFVFVLLIAGVIFLWEKIRDVKNPFKSEHTTEVTSNILLEKITAMGKLELVKYNFKDVVESKIQKDLLVAKLKVEPSKDVAKNQTLTQEEMLEMSKNFNDIKEKIKK